MNVLLSVSCMRLMLISHTLIRSDGMGSCHFPSVTGRQCARVDWTSSCSRSPVGRNIDLHYIVLVYIDIYYITPVAVWKLSQKKLGARVWSRVYHNIRCQFKHTVYNKYAQDSSSRHSSRVDLYISHFWVFFFNKSVFETVCPFQLLMCHLEAYVTPSLNRQWVWFVYFGEALLAAPAFVTQVSGGHRARPR